MYISSNKAYAFGHRRRTHWAIFCFVVSFFTCSNANAEDIDYAKQIAPLWQRNCSACHNSKKAEGGLNLETAALLLKGSDSGAALIKGKSAESEIVKRITATDDSFMPPKGNSAGAKPLTAKEIELIQRWIDQGANPGESNAPQSVSWIPMPGNVKAVYAIDASSDGQFVAAGRANQVAIYQWPTQTDNPSAVALIDPTVASTTSGQGAAHLDVIQSLAFSPNSQLLATGGYRAVKLWRRHVTPVDEPSLPEGTVLASPSVDGALLALVNADKSLTVVDTQTKQVKAKLEKLPIEAISMAWTDDHEYLLVDSPIPAIHVLKLVQDKIETVATIRTSDRVLQIVAPSHDKFFARLANGTVQTISKNREDDKATATKANVDTAERPPAPAQRPYRVTNLEAAITNAIDLELLRTSPPKLLVSARDGNCSVVAIETGKPLRSWKTPTELSLATVDRTGTRLATLGVDHQIRLWNIEDGKEIKTLNRDGEPARLVSVAKRNAARQESLIEKLNANLKELETANQKEQEVLKKLNEQREKAAAELAAKAADIEKNATEIKTAEEGIATAEKTIAEAMKQIEQFKAKIDTMKKGSDELAKKKEAAAAELAKQEQALAAGKDSAERAAAAIPAHQTTIEAAKTKLASLKESVEMATKNDDADRQMPASNLTFGPDPSTLLLAKTNGKIDVFTATAGAKLAELDTGTTPVEQLVVLVDRVIAKRKAAPAKTWNVKFDWRLERTIGSEVDPNSILSDRVTALAFSPDGNTLAVGSGPASRFGDMKTFSVRTGELIRDYGETHSDTILDIAYSPDGVEIASSGADKIVKVFAGSSDKARLSLEGHTHHVLTLAWQDNARVLASGSADGALKIWDTMVGEQQRTVQGFSKEITSLAFVGQSNQVAATCADNSLRLVDAGNGQTVRTYAGTSSPLYAVCLSADGKFLIAGGQDGKVLVWKVEKSELVRAME